MDLLRQASAQGPSQPAPRTQLQRRMGVSRAQVKEPTIKLEIPASVLRSAGSGGSDLDMLKQLAAGGGGAPVGPPGT